MTARRLLLVVVLLVLAGAAVQLHRQVGRERAAAAAVTARIAAAEKEVAAIQRAQAAALRDFDAATRQLAELPPPPDAAAGARDLEVRAWVKRVQRLRDTFANRPAQAVPELRLLTDGDWLRVARHADFESEEGERKALAAARDAARGKFSTELAAAVGRYTRAGNKAPESILAVVPYFENPPDLTMLQHYELLKYSPDDPHHSLNIPPWALREATAIDPDYDGRIQVNANGGMMKLGTLVAWIPDYAERSTNASRAYAAAHSGATAPNFASTAPYFDPPLDPALVEKMVKLERERNR